MWNSILLKKSNWPGNRISNADVENWFGHLKNNILSGERNIKCSRVLRKLREYVLFIQKEVGNDIAKTRLAMQNPAKCDDNSDERLSQTFGLTN